MEADVQKDWITKAHHIAWLLLGLIAVIVISLVYFRLHGAKGLARRIQSWQNGSGFREKCAVMFEGFTQGMQAMSSITDLLVAIAYSAVHWALVAFAYFAIARAFGEPLSAMNYPGAMVFPLDHAPRFHPPIARSRRRSASRQHNRPHQIFEIGQEAAVAVAIALWLITFAVQLYGNSAADSQGWFIGELCRLAREAKAEKVGTHVAAAKPSHPHGKDPGDGDSKK